MKDLNGQSYVSIVITYYPSDEAINNIKLLLNQGSLVIIVDNTPQESQVLIPLEEIDHLVLIKNNANLGIAKALNIGIDKAGKRGYERIFLFDQDSSIPELFFKNMYTFYGNCPDDIAMVGVNFYDVNSKTYAKYAQINTFRYHSVICDSQNQLDVSFAITSGTLISYSKFLKIGVFREDYFIDHVDSEYCLRAINNGFKIKINCQVVLKHSVGQRAVHKLLGVTIKPNNHPPVRRYYICRNGIRFMGDYFFRFPGNVMLGVARLVHEFLSVIFYEDEKLKKLKAMFIGLYDGLAGNMGVCKWKF